MEHANPAGLIIIILFSGIIFFSIHWAKRGKEYFIRKLRAVGAIDEAIGRAVELGRPISFCTGQTGVDALLYALLGILRHIARKVARFQSKLFVPCLDVQVYALSEATVQMAYADEGRRSQAQESSVRFLADEQFAYASGYMGLLHRENVGSAFLFGAFAAESLILAEAGAQVGAMQIAGTVSNEQIPFFVTTCDYTLLGEELYAVGAYFSSDPVQKGSLRGQDLVKLIILLTISFGVIIATYGNIVGMTKFYNLGAAFKLSW